MLLCAVPSYATGSEPDLTAEAALLLDMTTGDVLYERNANAKLYPASMTKMMTCILALENMDLSKYITVQYNDIKGVTGDKLNLYSGEEMNVGTMISAMMVISANDAANVLAREVAGSVEAFASMMNAKAAEIGCTGTNFVNANGLHDVNHYSTASDIAKIAMYCMENEVFRRVVARSEFTVPVTNKTSERYLKTTNWLLSEGDYKYDGCIGIKTGSTTPAGGCLCAAATRGNTTLLSVVMKSESIEARFTDSIALLDYGFDNFRTVSITAPAEIPETTSVKGGRAKTVAIDVPSFNAVETIPNTVKSDILNAKIVLEEKIQAPIKAGDVVGKLQIVDGEDIVKEYDITAKESVEKGASLPDLHFGGSLFAKILLIILIVFVALLILIGVYVIVQRKKTEKRKAARAARRAQIEEQEMQLRKEWEKTYHGRFKDEL